MPKREDDWYWFGDHLAGCPCFKCTEGRIRMKHHVGDAEAIIALGRFNAILASIRSRMVFRARLVNILVQLFIAAVFVAAIILLVVARIYE